MTSPGLSPLARLSAGIVCASASRKAGGILPIMQAHARELSRLGYTVGVHGTRDEFSQADSNSWTWGQLHLVDPLVSRFAYAPSLDRSLNEASHDIVHQHGLWLYPSIAVSRWRRRWDRPIVISTQGMLESWALANAGHKKRLAAWLFERANLEGAACIHCSESEVAGIRAFGLKTPIAVIANGVDVPEAGAKLARPAWLPDDGRRVLLFLGRLHPKKGIRETLEAWAILAVKHRHITAAWRLVFAGWDDGDHTKFATHARELGLADVLFPGPVYGDEKRAAFAHANAFILASYSEGLPMAILEAWSYGLPVFMTCGCNLPDGFAAGAAVEISTDPAALARVLLDRLPGADLPAIGMRGRKLVKTQFSWPRIGTQLDAVYQWLARGGPKPDTVRLW